jgi:hypothetical protein
LAFTLINELPRRGWRIILKLVAFALIGYLVLFNPWVQSRLVEVLHVSKGAGAPMIGAVYARKSTKDKGRG